jgi:thiol-disulfide isomerase/thioredoxin
MRERSANPLVARVATRRTPRWSWQRLAVLVLALAIGSAAPAEPVVQAPPVRGATALRNAEPPDAGRHAHTGPAAGLPAMARAGFADGRPLVLMFSLRGCPWCDALRREHFAALLREQDRLGVVAMEVDLTDSGAFIFDQPDAAERAPVSMRAATPRELGQLHKVRLAPTVLFLGPQGEVAQRLVGYGSPDFFGAYLEQRISQARSALAPASR